MRKWHKYIINYESNLKYFPKDEVFSEYKQPMGYELNTGYGSKEEFFRTYFYNGHPRFKRYHSYLTKNLKKKDEILSIGSGRCINELLLMEEGFNITCSDLDQPCREETSRLFPNLRFVKYDIAAGPFKVMRQSTGVAAGFSLRSSSQPKGCGYRSPPFTDPLPFEHKFDCILSLSMFYLFDENELLKVFRNAAESLKPGGRFVFDPGGAEDNFSSYVNDEIICKFEVNLIWIIQKLRRRKCVIARKHQGYRNKNKEIISIADKAGFTLYDLKCGDYLTEIGQRSVLLGRLPKKVINAIGRMAPYVRMFTFVKNQ